MSEQTVILEKSKRYSECTLWQMQRDYFDQSGINAWVNQVPFYVTSNPFIGASYAKLVAAFMRDWVAQHPGSEANTFYILELGTGSGRFSYYVLKHLTEILSTSGLSYLKFCYVMSDFTQNNLDFWSQHDRLQPFVERGVLDYALYNMEQEQPLKLQHQAIELTPEVLKNPLTVFANYIFDTVSHDVFRFENKRIFESLVTLQTPASNLDNGKVIEWDRVKVDHKDHLAKNNYYEDEAFNKVLDDYREKLSHTHVSMPVGGLRAIRWLRQLANDKLLVISSDKGFSQFDDLKHLSPPGIAFHGSFSIMVNFDAMARYFKYSGGDAVIQPPHEGIDSCVFSSGFQLADLPSFNFAVQEHVVNFSPADYFSLHRNISENFESCRLKTLVSHLALSRWDPHIFQKLHPKLYKSISQGSPSSIGYLTHQLPKIAEHYFYIPRCYDVFFDIGILLHGLHRYEDAIEYYNKSQNYYGDQYGNYYNRGLCLHSLGQVDDALQQFKRALEIDGKSKEAQDWVAHIEKTQKAKAES